MRRLSQGAATVGAMGKRKRQVAKGRAESRGQRARRAGGPGLDLVEVDLPPELLAIIDVDAVREAMRSGVPDLRRGQETRPLSGP